MYITHGTVQIRTSKILYCTQVDVYLFLIALIVGESEADNFPWAAMCGEAKV